MLVGITASTDADEAFADCDVALLIGARPRGKGMLRKDLLTANAGIFKAQVCPVMEPNRLLGCG